MNIIDVRDSIPSCNYSRQIITPRGIVYHITADTNKYQCLNWFRNPKARVSAHYVIEPDGDVHLCVSPNMRAYHAGGVKKPTAQLIKDRAGENPNGYMIGIEVVANGKDITQAQFDVLKELTVMLCDQYRIPLKRYNLVMHREIDMINKRFDPIISYHPNEIVRGIEADKKADALTNKINRLLLDKEELEIKVRALEVDYIKAEKIVKKSRKYSVMLKEYIKNILKKG